MEVKILYAPVIEVLVDPFLATELGNPVLAAQAFQHDADLFLG
jgi:hypothetical protein